MTQAHNTLMTVNEMDRLVKAGPLGSDTHHIKLQAVMFLH